MFRKINQTKMLIMPLAILLLSSTIVMATSNPVLPSAAYAISFGSTKNLSNNDGDSLDPPNRGFWQIMCIRYGVIQVEEMPIHFFKRSATSGDSFQNTKDLSDGKDGDAQCQRIAKEGNNVYVVWSEDGDILFQKKHQ